MTPTASDRSPEFQAKLAALAAEFRASLPGRVSDIEAAMTALGGECSTAALETLVNAAHNLAGAAGTFGEMDVSATAAAIEVLARDLAQGHVARDDGARARLQALLVKLQEVAA